MKPPLAPPPRGATCLAEGGVRFEVWAPRPQRVEVVLGAGGEIHPMDRGPGGVWSTLLPGARPGLRYAYRLDGERDRPDPVSRAQPDGVHGLSRVLDPRAQVWTDGAWRGVALEDLVLYEIHVGTFTREGTFDAVLDRLAHLRRLGITALELMPVASFPGHRNWGYDGVHLYAPQASYGGPEGLKRLVDAAHAEGLGVVLDVVYNHLGPEGNYLDEFGPYSTDRYGTPWGRAVNFDGEHSDEVRRYVLDNACMWVDEYHVDGLRLDAVHAIYDFGAHHILQELKEVVAARAEVLGRRVWIMAESDQNDPRLVRPPAVGGYGLDLQWNEDFHRAVHAALTRERGGYYEDFGAVEQIAKALRDNWVYDGRPSAYRRRRHGAPASDLEPRRLVVFVQNHDQVGNRAQGERLTALVDVERQKLAAALVLLSPFTPLLFMGEEYGETAPFLYFVDHSDEALLRAVREGRRREFERFAWAGEIAAPESPETFERSRPDPARAALAPHRELERLYRDLVRLRRTELAGARRETATSGGEAWVRLGYERPGRGDVQVVFHFDEGRSEIPLGKKSRLLFSTTDARYGGGSEAAGVALAEDPPCLVASGIGAHMVAGEEVR